MGTVTAFIPRKLLAYSKNECIKQKQKSRDTNRVLPLLLFSLMYMFKCLIEIIYAACMQEPLVTRGHWGPEEL